MPAYVPGVFPAAVTGEEFEEPVTPQQEHRKRVQAGVAVEALSHDLFGDKINGYTGSVSFSVTDVSIPGNSALPVAVARRVDINDLRGRGAKRRSAHVFEDWDLDIPHLHGVFEASTGWRAGPTPGVRCDQPNASLTAPPAIGTIESDDYWSGNHLYVPGQGDDEINYLSSAFPDRPTDGQTYRWITKGYWYFSCLSSTANGVPGDAFLARDPEGNRYWFNQVVEKLYAPLLKDINNRIARRETIILPTRIEDRFGNWVQYTYHPDNPRNLTRIEANDGRYLDLTYSNHTLPSSHITSVTDGVRTWTYDYITALEGSTLIGVGRPDGSAWVIDLGDFHADNVDTAFSGCGSEPGFVYALEKRANFTHPSGATAEFTFSIKKHGRNGAPKNCWVGLNETGDRFPPLFTSWTVIGKEIGGPGLQTPLQWVWTYPSATWAYNFQCEPNCVQTKTIRILEPDGSETTQEWGVHYGKNDGLLLAEEKIQGVDVLRRTEYEYRIDPANQAYPALVGTRTRLYPDASSGVHKPAISSKIDQQGVELASEVPSTAGVYAFDRFARATQALRASSLGFNKNEVVEYHHDLDTWVLGQTKKITNSVTGKIEREIDYDPITALPTTLKSFGRLEATLAHHPDGRLHTLTDAGIKTTTFTNYKRGIPRNVSFADAKSISGVVSDAGFLTDYTDELGNTTHYDFDALGRLTGITHPAGDSVNWTPTTITFEKQETVDYGIPEGHYKQSIINPAQNHMNIK